MHAIKILYVYNKIGIISYIARHNLGIQCNNTVHEVIINHPSMQKILLFDLTKKNNKLKKNQHSS